MTIARVDRPSTRRPLLPRQRANCWRFDLHRLCDRVEEVSVEEVSVEEGQR
jgi:hypothetical protein